MADGDPSSERTSWSRLLPRPRIHGEPARPARPTGTSTNAIDRKEPGDYTKLILRHRNRILLGVAASIVGAALIITLALLPIRTWFSQTDEIKKGQTELDALNAANAVFESQNQRLQTADGIKEEARRTLGLVDAKERKSPLLPAPALSPEMPTGLPYSLVTGIVAVRVNAAAAAAASATTVAAGATISPPTTTPVSTQPLITTAAADRANQTGGTAAPDIAPDTALPAGAPPGT